MVYVPMYLQMFSDLPASEVLASHMASSGRAQGEEGLAAPGSSKSEVTYPSHLGQAVRTLFPFRAEAFFFLLRGSQCIPPFLPRWGSRMFMNP